MSGSNFVVGIISIIIFVFAVIQIITFYNVKLSFFSLYISYYVFMIICIYIFGANSVPVLEIEGILKEINMSTKKGIIKSQVFNSDNGNVEMVSVIPTMTTGEKIFNAIT